MSFLDDLLKQVTRGTEQRRVVRQVLGVDAITVPEPTAPEATEAAISAALLVWHTERRMDGHIVIDDAHACSFSTCGASGSLVIIAVELSLYGCLNSGRHHVCNGNIVRGCREYVTTQSGDMICTFSKTVVGRTADDTLYGYAIEERDAIPIRRVCEEAAPLGSEGLENKKRQRDDVDVVVMNGGAAVAATAAATTAAVTAAAAISGGASAGAAPAIASAIAAVPDPTLPDAAEKAGVCAPLKRRRFGHVLEEFKPRDYGSVLEAHTSDKRIYKRPDAVIAPPETFVAIEGTDETAALGTVAPTADAIQATEDQRALAAHASTLGPTGSAPPSASSRSDEVVPRGGAEIQESSRENADRARLKVEYLGHHVRADIDAIIGTLFNRRYRNTVAKKLRTTAETNAYHALRRYYRRCAEVSVRPSAAAKLDIFNAHMENMPRLTTGPETGLDSTSRAKYVDFVYTLWEALVNSPEFERDHSQFRLVNHVAGTLYMLCGPFAVTTDEDAETIVDSDLFLVEHLPAQILLQDWSSCTAMQLRSTTRVLATKPIRLKKFVTFSKTGISTGRRAIKMALRSITDPATRLAISDSLRDAYIGVG